MLKFIKKVFKKINKTKITTKEQDFVNTGKIPWSKGYNDFKWNVISQNILSVDKLKTFANGELPNNFGHRIDERVVEYPWIFSNLNTNKERLLDAGSTFNFPLIVNHSTIKNKNLTIYTFAPEKNNYNKLGISYVYGDLRELPFKDSWFETIISQSTIEHIDMDNSIYGYDLSHNNDETKKSYEYIIAIKELIRVLKNKGTLMLTVPYGKFENHGFFQQFDEEMLNRILRLFQDIGYFSCTFFKYHSDGWEFSDKEELKNVVSFNPHSGKGKQDDYAAHCRGIACIKFHKY